LNKSPEITLLGAGIGDPDLITVKGMKALQAADVVLYDALANDALLGYASENCVKIYVGKRSKNHSYAQEDINQMLIDNALKYGHVVRLKGGDPYVFGRGHEELEAAQAAGITVEVIPGISSAIAAPAMAGIPVTKRGVNDSFWVFTGNNTEGGTPEELKIAMHTDATIVILMGVGKLNTIAHEYKKIGKLDMPIAVIQDASLPHQKVAIGTMETIENEVVTQGVGTPAVIVIGKVAAFAKPTVQSNSFYGLAQVSNKFDTTETNPLFPVFLKLHQLKLLIVGGGYVGLEKVTAVLQNSPQTDITLVAPEIRDEIVAFSKEHPNLKLIYKPFEIND
jgi:uroporphyrin-III C-methyltransferase